MLTLKSLTLVLLATLVSTQESEGLSDPNSLDPTSSITTDTDTDTTTTNTDTTTTDTTTTDTDTDTTTTTTDTQLGGPSYPVVERPDIGPRFDGGYNEYGLATFELSVQAELGPWTSVDVHFSGSNDSTGNIELFNYFAMADGAIVYSAPVAGGTNIYASYPDNVEDVLQFFFDIQKEPEQDRVPAYANIGIYRTDGLLTYNLSVDAVSTSQRPDTSTTTRTTTPTGRGGTSTTTTTTSNNTTTNTDPTTTTTTNTDFTETTVTVTTCELDNCYETTMIYTLPKNSSDTTNTVPTSTGTDKEVPDSTRTENLTTTTTTGTGKEAPGSTKTDNLTTTTSVGNTSTKETTTLTPTGTATSTRPPTTQEDNASSVLVVNLACLIAMALLF